MWANIHAFFYCFNGHFDSKSIKIFAMCMYVVRDLTNENEGNFVIHISEI